MHGGDQSFKLPAIYTHCYDQSGTRLFAAGGPLAVEHCGNYVALFQWEELALIVHYNATLKTRCDHCGIKKQPLLTILLPSYNGMPFSFRNLKLPKLENILIIKKLFGSYFCCVHSFRMYHCMSFWCLDIIKVAIFFKYVLKCVFSSLKSCWFTSYLLTSLQISILFSRRVQSYIAPE